MSRSCNLSDLVTQGWIRWRTNRIWSNGRSISRWPLTDAGSSAADEVKGYDSGSGITTLAEERVEGVRGQLRVTQSASTKVFVGQACVVTPLIQEGVI